MVTIVPADELFNSDELVQIENIICNLPLLRKIYDQKREFARFIDLPKALAEKAMLPYEKPRRVEFDVDTFNVRIYF
jgi:hypothetical protein